MMEGSRHEKAGLVVTAYAIGALSAFIYFSEPVVAPSFTVQNFESMTGAQSAAVIEAVQVEEAVIPVPEKTTIVSYAEGMLKVSLPEGEKVLSFNPEVANFTVEGDFGVQGVHYGEILFRESPTSEFVFFCEQKTREAKTCSPFVFDVLTDTIYPLRLNGELVDIITTAEPVWNETTLSIGTDSSKDPIKPWLLGY